MTNDPLLDRKISSALWAAYGDALGFPSELVDQGGLQRRVGSGSIDALVPWSRMVGGKFGVTASFGAGTYSDDTQLRLSTSRAIREDGEFDVEAFAKVELPVWLSYALGAGRGSKAAAAALSQRGVNWFSNFFVTKESDYLVGGGNGAAMRVQPHIWAMPEGAEFANVARDIIRNAICTHGHARGIAGALLHADSLLRCLRDGRVPRPPEWRGLGRVLELGCDAVEADAELRAFWLPTWNAKSKTQFRQSMRIVREEWERDVEVCIPLLEPSNPQAYRQIVAATNGFSPESRGSGLKAALLSLCLCWLYRHGGSKAVVHAAANTLGSDTDTIASMAGALIGAVLPDVLPSEKVQDQGYIVFEVSRLHKIARAEVTESFAYPDLMSWQPPQSQLECVGLVNNKVALAGIGMLDPMGEVFVSPRGGANWQWHRLHFGQTILCKRRTDLKELLPAAYPGVISSTAPYAKLDVRPIVPTRKTVRSKRSSEDLFTAAPDRGGHKQLDEIADEVIKSGFDPTLLGGHLLNLADTDGGIDLAVALAAIVARARRKRGR